MFRSTISAIAGFCRSAQVYFLAIFFAVCFVVPNTGLAQVTCTLSGQQPTVSNVCAGTQNKPVAMFNFFNAGSQPVWLQSVQLGRYGVSTYQTVTTIRLFNANGQQFGPSVQYGIGDTVLTGAGLQLLPGTNNVEIRVDFAYNTGGQTLGVTCLGFTAGGTHTQLLSMVTGGLFPIVNCQQGPIVTFTGNGGQNITIPCGGGVNLQWAITGADSAKVFLGNFGNTLNLPNNGNGSGNYFIPNITSGVNTFAVVAYGGGVIVTKIVTVSVQVVPTNIQAIQAECSQNGLRIAGVVTGCTPLDTVAFAMSQNGINWDTIPYFSYDLQSNTYITEPMNLSPGQILYYKYIWKVAGNSNWIPGQVGSAVGENIIFGMTSLTSSQTTIVAMAWLDNTPNNPSMVFLLEDAVGAIVDSQQISCMWNNQLQRCEYTYLKTNLPTATQYELQMYSQVWCTRWSDSFAIATDPYSVGIQGQVEDRFSVYPNPATNNVTINLSGEENGKIQIFSLNGQVVFEQQFQKGDTKKECDVSAITSGIYFVRFNGYSFKLVKE